MPLQEEEGLYTTKWLPPYTFYIQGKNSQQTYVYNRVVEALHTKNKNPPRIDKIIGKRAEPINRMEETTGI